MSGFFPKPENLQCEHAAHPLMVDTRNPRFCWQLSDRAAGGIRQLAYRIEVYKGTLKGSEDPHSDVRAVWDSPLEKNAYPFCGNYSGETLESFSVYSWRVRVRVSSEDPLHEEWESLPSDWALFETGAFSPGDIEARWISHPRPESYYEGEWESGTPEEKSKREDSLHYRAFYCSRRLSIPTEGRIIRARALVCGLGVYRFYVDGQPVGQDILEPAQTDFRKRALYRIYDITDSVRNKGNPLLTLLLGNGRHIKLYGFGKPRGLVQVKVDYEDGTRTLHISDGSWKIQSGPIGKNSIFNGEHYDERIPAPWDPGKSDDIEAVAAETIEGPPLKAASLPPVRIDRKIPCRDFWKSPKGFVFDMGQNFSGIAVIRVDLPRGTELILRFAELVHHDGSLNGASNRAARSEDRYIAAGGERIWHPVTTYHGFRYIELEGYPGIPEPEMIHGLFIHTDVSDLSEFDCSNSLLNNIHRNIRWGQLSNLMGIPTDSPQRDERHGWLGDALLSSEECLLNFSPVAFYEKFLDDIADTQNDDGSICDVAPRFWMDKPADPAWGSAFVSIAWHLYRHTGDTTILKRHYKALKSYNAFLMNRRSGDTGLIESLGTFGDWCAPGLIVPKKTGLSFTSSWYAHRDTAQMADIATLLGSDADAAGFRELCDEQASDINRAFLKKDRYESLPLSPWDFPDQTSQALALSSDIIPEGLRNSVAAALSRTVTAESGDHVGTGIHGTRYLLSSLSDNGYGEKAYAIATQRTYPGWGYMIEEGATTLWERWEKIETEGMNSHNHIMFGSIDVWLYNYVAGLRAETPGWESTAFRPGRFLRLDRASARCETPFGLTGVYWERDALKEGGDVFHLTLQIPPGSRGVLYLDDACRTQIQRSGSAYDHISWRLRYRNSRKILREFSETASPIRLLSGIYNLELTPIPE